MVSTPGLIANPTIMMYHDCMTCHEFTSSPRLIKRSVHVASGCVGIVLQATIGKTCLESRIQGEHNRGALATLAPLQGYI